MTPRDHDATMATMGKKGVLWAEWQTLAGHFTDDNVVIGEWFGDIWAKYSQPHRRHHTTEHVYQMVLNYKQFYQQLTYPRTVLFAIFFHGIIHDPIRSDNESRSVEEFVSCAEDLGLDVDIVRDVTEMIKLTASGHVTQEHEMSRPRVRDVHYFLDFDLAVLGSNPVEYMLYAARVRNEYRHIPEQEFCQKRAEVIEKFVSRKYVYATPEFRQFAEESARRNVTKELDMLRTRAEHLNTHTLHVQ